jgi:hypothetical protein
MPTEDQNSERSHQGVPQGGGIELSLDELAKGLASGTLSRGKALRWMGGALLGAALASVPGVAWANDCRRLGRQCRRDSQCCSNNCISQGDVKVCACPEGKTACNERCVNLERNDNHCGECFNRCDEDVECVEGVCGGSSLCPPREECDALSACGPDGSCCCYLSTEGPVLCSSECVTCDGYQACTSTAECPAGFFCSRSCCGLFCFPICGETAARSQTGQAQSDGLPSESPNL